MLYGLDVGKAYIFFGINEVIEGANAISNVGSKFAVKTVTAVKAIHRLHDSGVEGADAKLLIYIQQGKMVSRCNLRDDSVGVGDTICVAETAAGIYIGAGA